MKRIQPWKRLHTKRLLDHPDLQIDEDTIALPNGTKTTYVRHAPIKLDAVLILALNAQGQILLQQEYSYPPNQVLWQLPGGSMKRNETVLEAAARELAEESGYGTKQTEYLGYVYAHNRYSNRKQHIIVCRDLYLKQLEPDNDEFIHSYWKTPQEIRQMVRKDEIQNINLLAALMIWLHRSASPYKA